MLNLRSELKNVLTAAIGAAQAAGDLPRGAVPDILLEYPPERAGGPPGDYASPIALVLAKTRQRPPLEVAEAIAKHLRRPAFVSEVAVAPLGFVNFRLDPAWLAQKIDDVLEEGSARGRTDAGQGQSVNLEFLSANPTGFPHVGNGRALFTADVLGNVLAHCGYAVTREYYANDVGTQVERYGESVLRRILQAAGHAVDYPEELYPGEDVKVIAAVVKEAMDEDRKHQFSPDDLSNADLRAEVTRRAVDATLREIRRLVEEKARVRYDVWFRESTLHQRGDVAAVIGELTQRGKTVERDGAVWLKTTEAGDEKDRVLVRANGEATYLASDIAYHRDKLRRGFQLLIDFWGEDHQGHVLPLMAGLKALGEPAERLRIELVHLVRVVQGGEAKKIGKRLGTAVPLSEVLDGVGLSATRFFLTMKSLSSSFDFDLDLARRQAEDNPVYYVQYAYVRLASILRKAKQQNLLDGQDVAAVAGRVPLAEPTGRSLFALALRLPEVLEDIVRTWDVPLLAQYALALAQATHRFYDTVPVLQATAQDQLQTRLALVMAIRQTLGTILDLLGVEKREVM